MKDLLAQLYLTYRKEWIAQQPDGSYKRLKYSLHDGMIQKHLEGHTTVGVFAGKVFTKFITFDVDVGGAQRARELYYQLTQHYNIPSSALLVSYSGRKGYHIDLFFNEPIAWKEGYLFYQKVLDSMDISHDEVEFRPTDTLGVKLPLGVHKRTGRRCYLVDPNTAYRIEDRELVNVVPMDREIFKDMALFSDDEALEIEKVLSKVEINIPIDYEERSLAMLRENLLIYPDSRHSSTLVLLVYLNLIGVEEEVAIRRVQTIIENTFEQRREYIDKNTTLEYALKEVERLAPYTTQYDFEPRDKVIEITEGEIRKVLAQKNLAHQRLAFMLLVHSKKFGTSGHFYMTYKQMNQMGAASNRSKVLGQLLELESKGFLEIVQRSKREKNGLKHLPNKYRIVPVQNSGKNIKIHTRTNISFERAAVQLLVEEELRSLVSKSQFYNNFKSLYKENT